MWFRMLYIVDRIIRKKEITSVTTLIVSWQSSFQISSSVFVCIILFVLITNSFSGSQEENTSCVLCGYIRVFQVFFWFVYSCSSFNFNLCDCNCVCWYIWVSVCICAGVYARQIVLSSPVWVVENDMRGHCRLVVLVVDGVGEKTGWWKKQWCSFSHISSYW